MHTADQLRGLYAGQTVTSGSSGWLSEEFLAGGGDTDAIINYESSLYQLRDEGHDITVIVPRDGVISADYPLSTLAAPANSNAEKQIARLSEWLMQHQQEIADTYRRSVAPVDEEVPEIANQPVIELAFPNNYSVVNTLLEAYNNDLRAPGSTTFVLDASGSMEGERMESLKAIMRSLIDGTAEVSTGNVGLRDREMVTLLAFNNVPHEPTRVIFRRDDPEVQQQLHGYLDNLYPMEATAVYETLLQALHSSDTEHGIPSIVLLTDGEVTAGPGLQEFLNMYADLPENLQEIPVFVILYGEANENEMRELVQHTGGEVFDAINGDLGEVFKEIRGYQ